MITWDELKQSLIKELESKQDEVYGPTPGRARNKIIDALTPTDNLSLLALLGEKPFLGVVDNRTLIDCKNIDVFKIIRFSICQALSYIAFHWVCENEIDETMYESDSY